MPIFEPEHSGKTARIAVGVGLIAVVALGGIVLAKIVWKTGEAGHAADGSRAADISTSNVSQQRDLAKLAGTSAGSAMPHGASVDVPPGSQAGDPLSGSSDDRGDASTSAAGDGSSRTGAVTGRSSGIQSGVSANGARRQISGRPGDLRAGSDARGGPGGPGYPPAIPLSPSAAGAVNGSAPARDVNANVSGAATPPPPYGTSAGSHAETTPVPHTAPTDSHPDGTSAHAEPPPSNTDPESDLTPPVLLSIHFEPPQVTDGSAAAVLIQANDDLSGVKTITGSFRSPSGAAIIPFEAVSDGGGAYFTARFNIPSKAETGAWYVATLYLLDKAGNSQLLSFTPQTTASGSALLVSSSEPDSTPPTVSDISLEKASVRDGEKNQVRIRADDDRSGVATIWGSFQSASRSALLGFSCQLNPGSGLWEGEVQVPPHADCGDWNLQQLRVTDKAGNLVVLQGETSPVARVRFEVVPRADCDSSAPTLEAFSMSPTQISNETGAEVTVTATVRDVGSGTNSVVGWLSGPASNTGQTPKLQFSCQGNANDPNGSWIGRFQMPRFAAKGIWRVVLLRLFDNAHNMRDYTATDSALSGSTIEVQ